MIRIAGYTEDEKVEIAQRHLIPKTMEHHGLEQEGVRDRKDAMVEIIRRYTREAGVRNLEREISTLARKAVRILQVEKTKTIKIVKKHSSSILSAFRSSATGKPRANTGGRGDRPGMDRGRR